MAKAKRPYKESCARAAQLLAEGNSPWQAAQALTSEGCWLTSTGLTRWQRSSTSVAARRGAEMDALSAHIAPEPAPSPLARELRRSHKRMLTQEQWESLPEGLQRAIVLELVGGGR